MKNLKDIIESQNFLVNRKLKNRQQEYNYHPTTKDELQDIIIGLLKQGETDLNCIDVSKITDMRWLFTPVNNKITVSDIDISKWDVSNVKYMTGMFDDCSNFNSDLSNWDVSNVTTMTSMFLGCTKFNSDLSNWDVSNVTSIACMFENCYNFNSDLSKWKVDNVKFMHSMFDGCDILIKNNKIPVWYNK